MNSKEQTFILMHKDVEVVKFTVGFSAVPHNIQLYKSNMRHIPVGVSNSEDFKDWVRYRAIPVKRDGLSEDLKKYQTMGFPTVSTVWIMLLNRGVSLSDTYWFRAISDKNLNWDSVSPYSNMFKSSMELYQVESNLNADGSTFSPNASLNGNLRKKWVIREDGTRWLVKGNYLGMPRQSISEVFASLIHKYQGYTGSYVPYYFSKLKSFKGDTLGCTCPCMCSEGVEKNWV